MAARTGRYAKRRETLMKAYKYAVMSQTKISRFHGQFQKACDSNEISEAMALRFMPTFMEDRPASS